MRSVVFALVLAGCVACGKPSTPPRSTAPSGEAAALFRFHVDFWASLNQVLLHEALLPHPGFDGPKSLRNRHVVQADALAPAEAAQWHEALAYYDSHFTTHNLFDHFTGAIPALFGVGPAQTPAATTDLDEEWRSRLLVVAPVYRARFWPDHERRARAYIDGMRPVIDANGAWFAQRLVAVYATPLPKDPIDVDVTPAVPPFGGFTRGWPPYAPPDAPLITLSDEDATYAGDTGLEMLFHEVSHVLVGRVQDGLDASAKRQGRELPRGFWHDLIFYTAGHLARERLGATYIPYAERPSSQLFDENSPTLIALKRAWQPYLEGRGTMDAAIDAMVASF